MSSLYQKAAERNFCRKKLYFRKKFKCFCLCHYTVCECVPETRSSSKQEVVALLSFVKRFSFVAASASDVNKEEEVLWPAPLFASATQVGEYVTKLLQLADNYYADANDGEKLSTVFVSFNYMFSVYFFVCWLVRGPFFLPVGERAFLIQGFFCFDLCRVLGYYEN